MEVGRKKARPLRTIRRIFGRGAVGSCRKAGRLATPSRVDDCSQRGAACHDRRGLFICSGAARAIAREKKRVKTEENGVEREGKEGRRNGEV